MRTSGAEYAGRIGSSSMKDQPGGRAQGFTRRDLLKSGVAFAGAASILTFLEACSPSGAGSTNSTATSSTPATPTASPKLSGSVVVANTGGAFETALKKAIWDPFTAETGVQVTSVVAGATQVTALVQAKQTDVLHGITPSQVIQLGQQGLMEQIDNYKYQYTDLGDISPVDKFYLADDVFAFVLAYRTDVLTGKGPESWADFWDTSKFPGKRSMQDVSFNKADLEFAELAAGTPIDKLYPIDMDKAFQQLQKIKPSVVKFWTSPAMGAQLLVDKEAVMGSASNTRIQPLIDQGAPLAIQWNQAERHYGVNAIVKNANNKANAFAYLDFAMQPKSQAALGNALGGLGIVNKKAVAMMDQTLAAKTPTFPDHAKAGYDADEDWWLKNRQAVTTQWRQFSVGG